MAKKRTGVFWRSSRECYYLQNGKDQFKLHEDLQTANDIADQIRAKSPDNRRATNGD